MSASHRASRLTLALAFALGLPTLSFAATYTVNTTADTVDAAPGDGFCADASGFCSLRAAVMEANALAGPDQIDVPAGTIELTLFDDPSAPADEDLAEAGDLDLLDDVTISGAGPAQTQIDGLGADRVFWVGGVVVVLRQLTVRGGVTFDAGGGILNEGGDLTLEDAVVSANMSLTSAGGGVENFLGLLTVRRVSFEGNSAYCGGGIDSLGDLVLVNATFIDNTATCQGGGVLDAGFGVLSITNSTFAYNQPENLNAVDLAEVQNSLFIATPGATNCTIFDSDPMVDFNRGGNAASGAPCDSVPDSIDPALFASTTTTAEGQRVVLPLAGNPVIDAAIAATCDAVDQRGVTRPQGAVCDSGAVEIVPMAITSGAPPASAAWNVPLVHVFTATGEGAITFAVTAGALPPGLTVSSSGVLTGTPTTIGMFSFTVTATDAVNQTASLPASVQVTGAPLLISGTPPRAVAGAAYSFSFAASGNGALTFSLSAGSLPAGLALSASGAITGSTTQLGTFPFTVQVQDQAGQTNTLATSISVSPPLVLSGTPPRAIRGQPYSFNFTASGDGAVTFSISAGSPPPGLSLSTAGALSGTPTAAGAFAFTVQAVDSVGQTATLPVSLSVSPPLVLSGTPPRAIRGQPYSFNFTASGDGAVTFSISAGSPPPGLSLSTAGALSGTPTAAGAFAFTVQAVDSVGQTATLPVSLSVSPPLVLSGTPPMAHRGQPYSFNFTASGDGAVTFSIAAGSPPPGLSLSTAGALSGTPTVSGLFAFTVQAVDSVGQTATLPVSQTVNGPPVVAGLSDTTIDENATAVLSLVLSDDLTAAPSLTASATSSNQVLLPDSSVVLSGSGANRTLTLTPAVDLDGTATVTVVVSDGTLSTTTTFVLTVTAALAPQPPAGLAVSVSGSQATFTWSAPGSGSAPTFYVLEVGSVSGGSGVAVVNTRMLATTWTMRLAPSGYYARVRAGNGAALSAAASNEVAFAVNGVLIPGPPRGLVAIVGGGGGVTIGWQPPVIGGSPTGWQAQVGTTPGGSDVGVFDLPAGALNASGTLAGGEYYVRLVGRNALGLGAASNEVQFRVGAAICTSAPQPPVMLPAMVVGWSAALQWSPPRNAPVTGYRLLVGSSPGQANLATLDVGAVTSFFGHAAPGTYHVAAQASNACGTGEPSASIAVVIGASQYPPPPPANPRAALIGRIVTILWDPTSAQQGSFMVEAGVAPGSTAAVFFTAGNTLVVNGVPSGTFYIRVRSIGTSGTSGPSREIVVQVP